ncbi:hypothetical protein BMS_1759 [Halobacteriovorax marinus SJ]|uniref:PKD domain-containing protein n=1 Tax=Halobacteriovorax marinus (strain ATCC BAA-682 / DSM 15412 / SJ) TaxID=862908 RepID=E1X1S6_HALMS|nr:PKD domain-containing protein [Halobacteriovorax marinus]CBW26586.1 hypothetical protein BMS_1759 [Halobacteriovorax marinus SJ]
MRTNRGESATSSTSTNIALGGENMPPIAELNCNETGALREVKCNISNSRDIDGEIIRYMISFGDGNSIEVDNPQSIYHSYVQNGVYEINLIVEDNDGATGESSHSLEFINQMPVVEANCLSYSFNDLSCESFSYDVDGYIVNTEFIWDEGSISGQETYFSTTLNSGGFKQIIVRVTDNEGLTSEKFIFVNVLESIAPVASFSCSNNLIEKIKCVNESNDEDSDELIFKWRLNDTIYNTLNLEESNISGGEYEVSLVVTDLDGNTSIQKSMVSVVNNIGPVSSFECNSNNTLEINCSSTSYDEDGQIVNYLWLVDEVEVSSNQDLIYKQNKLGSSVVRLVVGDDNNSFSSYSKEFSPKQPLPTKIMMFCNPNLEDKVLKCDGNFTDVDSGTIEEFKWTIEDKTYYGNVILHENMDAGELDVKLSVKTSLGEKIEKTERIYIPNLPSEPSKLKLLLFDEEEFRFFSLNEKVFLKVAERSFGVNTKDEPIIGIKKNDNYIDNFIYDRNSGAISIDGPWNDGLNVLEVEGIDDLGREVVYSFDIWAGGLSRKVLARNLNGDTIDRGEVLVEVLDGVSFVKSFENGEVLLENIPSNKTLILRGEIGNLFAFSYLNSGEIFTPPLIYRENLNLSLNPDTNRVKELVDWHIIKGSLDTHLNSTSLTSDSIGELFLETKVKIPSQMYGGVVPFELDQSLEGNDFLVFVVREESGVVRKFNAWSVSELRETKNQMQLHFEGDPNEILSIQIFIKKFERKSIEDFSFFKSLFIENVLANNSNLSLGYIYETLYLRSRLSNVEIYELSGDKLQGISLGTFPEQHELEYVDKSGATVKYNPLILKYNSYPLNIIPKIKLRISSADSISNSYDIEPFMTYFDKAYFRVPSGIFLGDKVYLSIASTGIDENNAFYNLKSYCCSGPIRRVRTLGESKSLITSFFNVLKWRSAEGTYTGAGFGERFHYGSQYFRENIERLVSKLESSNVLFGEISNINGGYFFGHSGHKQGLHFDLVLANEDGNRPQNGEFSYGYSDLILSKESAIDLFKIVNRFDFGEVSQLGVFFDNEFDFNKSRLVTFFSKSNSSDLRTPFLAHSRHLCTSKGELFRDVLYQWRGHSDHLHLSFRDYINPKVVTSDYWSPSSDFLSKTPNLDEVVNEGPNEAVERNGKRYLVYNILNLDVEKVEVYFHRDGRFPLDSEPYVEDEYVDINRENSPVILERIGAEYRVEVEEGLSIDKLKILAIENIDSKNTCSSKELILNPEERFTVLGELSTNEYTLNAENIYVEGFESTPGRGIDNVLWQWSEVVDGRVEEHEVSGIRTQFTSKYPGRFNFQVTITDVFGNSTVKYIESFIRGLPPSGSCFSDCVSGGSVYEGNVWTRLVCEFSDVDSRRVGHLRASSDGKVLYEALGQLPSVGSHQDAPEQEITGTLSNRKRVTYGAVKNSSIMYYYVVDPEGNRSGLQSVSIPACLENL